MDQELNPIVEMISQHVAKGERVFRVSPMTLGKHPPGIVVKFADGEEVSHNIASRDHDHFIQLWKEAGKWFKCEWDLKPQEKKETE
jgi:hypothetical protein